MTRDEALALHRELETLLGWGPGGINDQVRDQLGRIEFFDPHSRRLLEIRPERLGPRR